ncbi:sn-glycerol-3-phosphate ABC transporter ATP-binding protein UgpC, partial [Vibrio sp. 10N.222.55.F12]
MKNNNDTTQMNNNRIQSLNEYKTSHLPSHQAIHKNTEDTPMPNPKQKLAHNQATHNRTRKAPTMLGIKNLVKTYENGHQAVKGVS